jgi:hypothetical protein
MRHSPRSRAAVKPAEGNGRAPTTAASPEDAAQTPAQSTAAQQPAEPAADAEGPVTADDRATPRLPMIEPEPAQDDKIRVGAGQKLHIPREACDDDDDDADEEEVVGAVVKIRKPGRRERILLDPTRQMVVKLLPHKPGGEDTIEEVYYYVPKGDLRDGLSGELKSVRVSLYYALKARRFRLWLVKISPGNDWYDSLSEKVFKQPPGDILKHTWKIASDRVNGFYRVKRRPIRPDETVTWPDRTVEELLGEAIGRDHVISSPDHELYDDLVSGEEV